MKNSVFGKAIENIRTRVNVELVSSKAMKASRAQDCKYRQSLARLKNSKLLIICFKNPFGALSSKKIFFTFKNLQFSRK